MSAVIGRDERTDEPRIGALIVGVQKCGTTTLAAMPAAHHPEVRGIVLLRPAGERGMSHHDHEPRRGVDVRSAVGGRR